MSKLVELFKQQYNKDLLNLGDNDRALFCNFLSGLPSDINEESQKEIKEIIKVVLEKNDYFKKRSVVYNRNFAAFLCQETKLSGNLVKEIIKENKLNFAETESMDKGDFQAYLLGRRSTSNMVSKRNIHSNDMPYFLERMKIAYDCGFKCKVSVKDREEIMYGFSKISFYGKTEEFISDYVNILIDKDIVNSGNVNKVIDKCIDRKTIEVILPLLKDKNLIEFEHSNIHFKSIVSSMFDMVKSERELLSNANMINDLNIPEEDKSKFKSIVAAGFITNSSHYIDKEAIKEIKAKSFYLMEECLKLNDTERMEVSERIKKFRLDNTNKRDSHMFLDDIIISFVEEEKKILREQIGIENSIKTNKNRL